MSEPEPATVPAEPDHPPSQSQSQSQSPSPSPSQSSPSESQFPSSFPSSHPHPSHSHSHSHSHSTHPTPIMHSLSASQLPSQSHTHAHAHSHSHTQINIPPSLSPSSSTSSSSSVSSPPPPTSASLRTTTLPSLSASPSPLTSSDRSVSTPVLPRPLETYHLAYLYSWPLIGKMGVDGTPFVIKQLGFEKEQQSLLKTLETAKKAITIRMEVATSTNLSTLVTMGCRALHYTGHGKPSCLAFEDGVGRMHAMDATQLKRLFEAGGRAQGVKFVFVSACYSESAGKAFAAAGVPHVIAVKCDAQLADRSAQLFTTQLYLALLVGHTVRHSFDIAREAVQADPNVARSDEPKKFLLLPPDGNHDVAIFGDIENGEYKDESSPPKPHTLPSQPENFQGRNALLQQVVEKCIRKRLVTLVGEHGIGKTALAIAAGHYLWKRSLFDGVFFVELSRISSAHRSLASLCGEACHMSPPVHDMSSLLQSLRGKGKRYLIILDGADELAGEERGGPRCVKTFINELMHNSVVHVLVTSPTRIGDIREVPEQEITVTPLSPNDASQLFWDLRPRELALSEFGCTDPLMAGTCLSQHEALKLVAGHPGRIFNAARLLAEAPLLDDLPDLIRQYETAMGKNKALDTKSKPAPDEPTPITHIPQPYPQPHPHPHPHDPHPIPSRHIPFESMLAATLPDLDGQQFWRSFGGERTIIPWQEMEPKLCQHFLSRAGHVERTLSMTDLIAIKQRLEILGSPRDQVTLPAFSQFWPWLIAFEATIRKIATIWNTRHPHILIHGLMSRTHAGEMLRNLPLGTFILRFSETSPGCIAVAFVDQSGAVQHTLIDTRGSGYKIVLTDGEREYDTLPELIMKCRPMTYIYPNVPKEDAFSPPQDQPH